MALNSDATYGVDFACYYDATPLFDTVTGLDSVKQDVFHRITTDNVNGPNGIGWGFNVARLLGIPARQLPAYQLVIREVILRDPRVDACTVGLAATTTRGLSDVALAIHCDTASGPFDIIKNVSELTAGFLESQTP